MSAPVPFGFRSYWDLVGVGPRGFWDLGFGDRAWQLVGHLMMISNDAAYSQSEREQEPGPEQGEDVQLQQQQLR